MEGEEDGSGSGSGSAAQRPPPPPPRPPQQQQIRVVRCPKCDKLLPELPNYSVYVCGGCGATLQGWCSPFSSAITPAPYFSPVLIGGILVPFSSELYPSHLHFCSIRSAI